MKLNKSFLEKVVDNINEREDNAKKAERESVKLKQTQYMLSKIDSDFEGIITNIGKWGVEVTIEENGCVGTITTNSLYKKGLYPNEELYSICYPSSDEIYKSMGDMIRVKISDVDMVERKINLELI